MSKIMVLPGTVWQVPLIKSIKHMGHHVLLVNPTENPGVRELADRFLATDIFDVDLIEEWAKENRIDAIISDECDIAMPVVAELGSRLKLPCLSREAAVLYTNKFLMREFGAKNGFNTVPYKLCETPDEAIAFLNQINKSIVIKPIDSNASHGVFTARTEQDIRKYFDETLSFSRSRKAVLVERYVNGTEFTVDGIKTPDQHFTLAISEKKHFKHNENIASELLFTHKSETYDYKKLKAINDLFVMKSPLSFGLTHAEYKYENGEFYLIEIAARGGGNLISSLIVEFMSGYDTYEYLINWSLGKSFHIDFTVPESHHDRVSVLKFFDIPKSSGIVKRIDGIDYLKKEKDIVSISINCSLGDRVGHAKNDSDRLGYYIACSENKEKLANVMKMVNACFRIVVE